jgi:anti-sigma regulatory factor (Ser/Thr protein kinase)
MDPELSLPAPAESADARRDATMATALLRLRARLRPDTATAYLLTGDGHDLAAAMTLDTPLSFTISPGMPVDDVRYTTAAAHQSRQVQVKGPEGTRRVIEEDPEIVQYVPFPVLSVSAPVHTARRRLGVLTLRWAPPRELPPACLEDLAATAAALALELEELADQGAAMHAPATPSFVPAPPGRAGAGPAVDGSAPAGRPPPPGTWDGRSDSSTFLFQFQRLATELTATEHVRDVVAAAQRHVVRPFGGRAMMLCLAERGRLLAVGSAGFAPRVVRRVNGTLLAAGTPEADATLGITALSYDTRRDLRAAYPALARYDEQEAHLFLPIVANGRAVGCCVLAFDHPPALRDGELAVLVTMLGQVGQSLERARSYERQQTIARTMQQGLLPRTLPHLKEIATATRYLPASAGAEVGGDWYDVIGLPGGGIGLVIGDVEGHSLEAVGIMAQLRSGVRAYAAEGHDPASLLARSNRLLAELDTDLFATCCCMWLDPRTGLAHLASAGHHLPAIVGVDGHPVTPQPGIGPPLGVDPGALYHQTELTIPPGAVAALYTDGLLGDDNRDIDRGVARLHHCLVEGRDGNLEALADSLVDFRPQARRADDTALLLVRYEGGREAGHGRVARMTVQRHDLQRVRHLRHFLRDLVPGWGLHPILDDLELLVSEVVTNALIHAHSDVDVRLREYPGRLRVDVRDSDPHQPVPVAVATGEITPEEESESGRGLHIVDAVATAWGSSPAGRGKTTWFELAVPKQPQPQPQAQPQPQPEREP